MAMNWVGIIRPFETAKITPPATPAKADPSTNKNVVIMCGDNSSPTIFSGSFRFDQTYYKIRRPKEKRKTTGATATVPDSGPTPPENWAGGGIILGGSI